MNQDLRSSALMTRSRPNSPPGRNCRSGAVKRGVVNGRFTTLERIYSLMEIRLDRPDDGHICRRAVAARQRIPMRGRHFRRAQRAWGGCFDQAEQVGPHPPDLASRALRRRAPRAIVWGARDPAERGPVVATVTRPADRNAIGAHGGAYGVYRALAVTSAR